MFIKKWCLYKSSNYNLLPAILVTPKEDGFTIAIKFINFHFGVYICRIHNRRYVMEVDKTKE